MIYTWENELKKLSGIQIMDINIEKVSEVHEKMLLILKEELKHK